MIIVLTGIDGSGKSTAARALVEFASAGGGNALLAANHAGRRTMSGWGARTGITLPAWLTDGLETAIRVFNVLRSHLLASRHDGLVVMDRHLYCQLALREAKGLPRGRFLPWLLATLPAPDLVLHLDVRPNIAYQRVAARGTDEESLADLIALDAAYRRLPEYPGFTVVDANGPADDVGRALSGIVAGAAVSA